LSMAVSFGINLSTLLSLSPGPGTTVIEFV
jgi:hypothetical protein